MEYGWVKRWAEPSPQPQAAPANGLLSKLKHPMITTRKLTAARRERQMGRKLMSGTDSSAPPMQGIPMGTIGTGSITRGWRGDFRRWSLTPGVLRDGPVAANAFSIRVERDGKETPEAPLSSWEWKGCDPECVEYKALFPRATTRFQRTSACEDVTLVSTCSDPLSLPFASYLVSRCGLLWHFR
jgi:hypothetical protein